MAGERETLGAFVRRKRDAMGLTQSELARLCGFPVTTLKNIEQDSREPRLTTAAKLAKGLRVRLETLAALKMPGRGTEG